VNQETFRTWDEKEVERATCDHFGEKAAGAVEGPVRLGECRVWLVWTNDGKEFHAHYTVAHKNEPLKFHRNFGPFADWLHDAFTEAGRMPIEAAKHARRLEIVRVVVASIIVLALLGLVVFQVGVRNADGLNVSHVISVLLGGGVAYLLGEWVRKSRT